MFTDLESWRNWQASRRRLHTLKDRLRGGTAPSTPAIEFHQRGEDPELLVVCESDSPTNHHSLLAPLELAADAPVVVAKPPHVSLELPAEGWRTVNVLPPMIKRLASIGDHLPLGGWAHPLAAEQGWDQFVVQHGLLTPFAPPPPRGAHVFTWTEVDQAFLAAGRPDLTFETVGSPLLWNAHLHPAPHVSRFETPVFLGQLHGSELSRTSKVRSVTQFWRETGCTYRPHPREEDKLSRLQHVAWRRMGMRFDTSRALAEVDQPVVAAFSTGVLEAAVRGVPAWVHHVDPPDWLTDFWHRYGLSTWGQDPSRGPSLLSDPDRRLSQALFA